jgi:hypothetical protein
MNRTMRRKIMSVLILALIIGSYKFLFDVGGRFALPLAFRIIFIVTLVILLNISTFALRKVFVARRLLRQGRNEEAATIARQFITEIETRPWKRLACQFAIEVCTNKPEVLGYMCLAQATRQAGDLPTALATYQRAVEIDPLCPTAHLGLAVTSGLLGDEINAKSYLDRARELGFSWSLSDRLFIRGGDLTANLALSVPVKRD